EPQIQPADVDEEALLARAGRDRGRALSATEAVGMLARAKAEQVAATAPAADLVLGCDSLLELDGLVHGKPGTVEVARQRWRAMRGRTGVLHTGHWLIRHDDEAPHDGEGPHDGEALHDGDARHDG